MTTDYGPIATAWARWCERRYGVSIRRRPTVTPLEGQRLIDVRPPPPVERATDTIIGWQLDPRWLG